MNIKNISSIFLSINTLKMLKKDSPIFLQNINMIACQLFLLFKKSTIFWDNPRKLTVNNLKIGSLEAGALQYSYVNQILNFKT